MGLRNLALTQELLHPAPTRYAPDCYRWRGDDEVNDRSVGKPQEEGMMNIAASFSLSKKPRLSIQ
jgi:hypothetical protein